MNSHLYTILVTGGSGFLGRHLVEKLLEHGHNVVVLDIKEPPLNHANLTYFNGSFADTLVVQEAIKGCDIVYHLASTTIPKTSNDDPIYDIESNLCGSVRLIQEAVKSSIERFIFVSSGGTIYGAPSTLPVPESHDTNSTCSYGITKLSIEKYLYMFQKNSGIKTFSLRVSNPYGEHQNINSGLGALTTFCYKAINGEDITIWGDGTVVRDFIYIDDVVNALTKTLLVDHNGAVINIGYGKGISLNELIDLIQNSCDLKINVEYQKPRNFDIPEIYLDIKKAESILNWKPETNLQEGVNRLIQHIKSYK